MKKTVLFFLFVCYTLSSFAQITHAIPAAPVISGHLCKEGRTKVWDKRYGGFQSDLLKGIVPTTDGGYLLAGSSYSDASGDKTTPHDNGWDFWVVKVDANGNKQWDNSYSNKIDELVAVVGAADGGYLLGGQIGEFTIDHDVFFLGWLVKIDANGNKLWDKTIVGDSTEYFNDMIATRDGGFLIGMNTLSGISGDKTEVPKGEEDFWLIKIDANGNKLWDKTIGSGGIDVIGDMIETSDGGYLIGGTSGSFASGDRTEGPRGYLDYWVVKTDAYGNKIWD